MLGRESCSGTSESCSGTCPGVPGLGYATVNQAVTTASGREEERSQRAGTIVVFLDPYQ